MYSVRVDGYVSNDDVIYLEALRCPKYKLVLVHVKNIMFNFVYRDDSLLWSSPAFHTLLRATTRKGYTFVLDMY